MKRRPGPGRFAQGSSWGRAETGCRWGLRSSDRLPPPSTHLPIDRRDRRGGARGGGHRCGGWFNWRRRAAIVGPVRGQLFPAGQIAILPGARTPIPLRPQPLIGFRSRRELAPENIVLRHQLQVALRTNPTPRLRPLDRVLWVWIDRLWPASRRHLLIFRPETVLRWHGKGWRLYWAWRSRGRIGRPHLSAEVKDLIAQIPRLNRPWGPERIRAELRHVT